MLKLFAFVLAFALSNIFIPRPAMAEDVIVGVNVVAVDQASEQDRDALLAQLQQHGVKTIRTALGGHGDQYTSFVIKAYQHGIGSVVMVDPDAGNTKQHALPPNAAAGIPWGVSALSDADPEGFRKIFTAQLQTLEAAGVKITAFELGNEINTPRFNGDFRPEQHSGRLLGVSDLNNPNDREAATVAAGYRAYLRVMATLKDIRDHSKLNQRTPILTGMSAAGFKGYPRPHGTTIPDAVGIDDSIDFLRQNGLDKLADGYAVHAYQSGDPKLSVSERVDRLEKTGMLSTCGQGARACWITEWAFNNASQACPLDDSTRAAPIQGERAAIKQFAERGQIAALLYYSWSGNLPPSWSHDADRKADPGAIYRCGTLTEPGKLAISPL
jgi:hypothetical protein